MLSTWTTVAEKFDLKIERRTTDPHKKTGVASPAIMPKTYNSILENENSIDLAAKMPVQKTIVSGLDSVNIIAEINTIAPLEWLGSMRLALPDPNAPHTINTPNATRTTELPAPRIFFIRSFFNNLPTPKSAKQI